MKISYNWLKEYAKVDLPPEKMAELLTGCGLEVESLERWSPVRGGLEGIVVGEVLTCVKHPGSDHLSLTTVTIGAETPLKIVCGASNIAAGQKVAVATIGSTLYFSDKELKIQRTKIRGEVSEGMICAEDELGMGSSHDGIMVLEPDARTGTPGKEYFHLTEDHIFEIGLTPNRVDASSHTGVARDLVAVLNNFGKETSGTGQHYKLEMPDVSSFRPDLQGRRIAIEIDDPKACPRYSGLTITGVKVAESPEWLKHRLTSIGLRPINNIVDITNFVLFELGQPLHAFDADRIDGDKVIVRKYPGGTPFVTLDGVERKLTENDLMICSPTQPMCIGGVFGGLGSGVTAETQNLFLESAYFDPQSIRRTSKHHGLQTDASFRFERGANYEITTYALKRAALMIKELAGGTISSDIVDVYPTPFGPVTVELTWQNLDRLIGQAVNRKVVGDILGDLGIEITGKLPNDAGLKLWVPPFKPDVLREADLIEEVLRIYGYNNILIPEQVRSSLTHNPKPDPEKVRNIVSDLLTSKGFFEIMNNSLTPSAYYEGDENHPTGKLVRILNPISRDLDVMRQTLLYGGIETIVYNQNRKASDLKLYEFGTVYSLADPSSGVKEPVTGYHEEQRLGLFLTGSEETPDWNVAANKVDFFSLKSMVEAVFSRLNLSVRDMNITRCSSPYIPDGLCYQKNEQKLARIGALSKGILKRFDIRQEVFYADVNWDILVPLTNEDSIRFAELPKFPEVKRDLALLVDRSVEFAEIEKIAFETEKSLLKQVGLFDVYEGDQVEAGKKSYAVNFILLDEEKTLTDTEIDGVMQKLMTAFGKRVGARIR
jgi:phenylalanyl-tRNA synthetase beta chain